MSIKMIPASEYPSLVGQKLGTSDWFTLDQQRINVFADCTEDHQFIHVDEEAAAKTPLAAPSLTVF